ncbi:MAG: uroporphyrinogen decarboxylase [Bacteroidota bacterium]|nr:uroporphyrinogen decarboxylase [Bacteroidota bacterium]
MSYSLHQASPFIKACESNNDSHIPVWFMRQAGRYQPEYKVIRQKYSLIEICKHPEICAQVTTLPITQLGVDAAILFSDITLPLEPMGIDFEIKEGIGPVIYTPILGKAEVDKLKPVNAPEGLPYVGETIRMLSESLSVPLIGFVGAPFTLASYMIEGGPSKNYYKTKAMMYNDPETWHQLMRYLAVEMGQYLSFQIQNGCAAVQVFDSWVGSLSLSDYREFIYPHMATLFMQLSEHDVPKIHFGVNTNHLLAEMYTCGATVVGLDWKTEINRAKAVIPNVATQGNIDPALLLAPWTIIKQNIDKLVTEVDRTRFIFNLGHGVMPQASIETLRKITDYVHSL